jgi:hypothetical protein
MTTTDIDPKQLEGLGFSGTETILAFRTRQAGVRRFSFAMPIGTLIRSVKRPDPAKPFPGNRKVEQGRANKFADYLWENASKDPGWTCPPLQLRAAPEEIKSETTVSEDVNLVKFEVSKYRSWDIQDGQHRILGFNIFAERQDARIAELRRMVTKAERDGDRQTAAIHARTLRDVEARRRAILDDSQVEVVLVVADDAAHGQMFADIAIHAKGINPDFATLLDERDPVHRIATDLMQEYTPISGLVNDGQLGRTSTSSPYLVGAKSLADVCHGVIVGSGRVGKRMRDEIEQREAVWSGRVKEFLAVLFESFTDLQRVQRGELDAPALREESLIASATMIRVLAIAWHESLYSDGKDRLTVAQVREFFTKLEPHMRCFEDVEVTNPVTGEKAIKHGVPIHSIWMGTGKFQLGTKAPSARQGDVNEFGKVLAAWAKAGIPDSGA